MLPSRKSSKSQGGGDGTSTSQEGGDGPVGSQGGGDGPLESQRGGDGPIKSQGGGDGPLKSQGGGHGPLLSQGGGDGPLLSQGGGDGPLLSQGEGDGLSSCIHPAGHSWFLSIMGCRSCLRCHKMSSPGHYWSPLRKRHSETSRNTVEQQKLTTRNLENQQKQTSEDSVEEHESIKEGNGHLADQHKPDQEKPLSSPTFLCQHPDTVKHSCSQPGGHDWFLSITGLRSCLRCHKMSTLENDRPASRKRRIKNVCDGTMEPQKLTVGHVVVKNELKGSALMDTLKPPAGKFKDPFLPAKRWDKKRKVEDEDNISTSQISSKYIKMREVSSKCVVRREGLQHSGPDGHIWFLSIIGVKSCLRCNRIAEKQI